MLLLCPSRGSGGGLCLGSAVLASWLFRRGLLAGWFLLLIARGLNFLLWRRCLLWRRQFWRCRPSGLSLRGLGERRGGVRRWRGRFARLGCSSGRCWLRTVLFVPLLVAGRANAPISQVQMVFADARTSLLVWSTGCHQEASKEINETAHAAQPVCGNLFTERSCLRGDDR